MAERAGRRLLLPRRRGRPRGRLLRATDRRRAGGAPPRLRLRREGRPRRGGGQLAAFAEEAARDLGALSVTLKAETDNEAAMRLYQGAGYEELGRRHGMATMRKDFA
ncbi:hypothetical protein N177_1635 [Lutibaculum baratangense AMV1]|uniref:N-acetyltransferase domain-containing protein n=1 Tax=Lutibaculum baratangense AMV1 TaxID=631454 RepID=V4THL7_9HYPH|nr:hypothetical protein N177_1635 [Lutibaculum baratangense AMV1]